MSNYPNCIRRFTPYRSIAMFFPIRKPIMEEITDDPDRCIMLMTFIMMNLGHAYDGIRSDTQSQYMDELRREGKPEPIHYTDPEVFDRELSPHMRQYVHDNICYAATMYHAAVPDSSEPLVGRRQIRRYSRYGYRLPQILDCLRDGNVEGLDLELNADDYLTDYEKARIEAKCYARLLLNSAGTVLTDEEKEMLQSIVGN